MHWQQVLTDRCVSNRISSCIYVNGKFVITYRCLIARLGFVSASNGRRACICVLFVDGHLQDFINSQLMASKAGSHTIGGLIRGPREE